MGERGRRPEGDAGRQERRRSETRHLLRASVIVSGLGVVSKGLGMLRESAVAAIFGAVRAMDAFLVALAIPNMFSTWVRMPIRAALVPLFTRHLHEEGEERAWAVASNVVNTLALGLVLLVGVLWLAAPLLVRALSLGFRDEASWAEATRLTRILVLSIVFTVLAVVFGSLQNVYRRQHWPAIARVVQTGIVVAAIVVLGPRIGLTGYALGILAGAAASFLLQGTIVLEHLRYWRPIVRPFAPEVREVVSLALPLFIGLTGTRLDVILDRNFASFLPEGQLTMLWFAFAYSAVFTDLVVMVSQAVFLPHFAHLAAEGRTGELRRRLGQALSAYLFLTLPVAAFLVAGAGPVIDLFLRWGKFTAENAALTARLLAILALGSPFYLAGQLLAQVFISTGDTRTPVKIGFWRIGFKALLSAILLPLLLVQGLAIATTFSSWFRTGLLWRRLGRDFRPEAGPFLGRVGRLVLAATAGGLAAWAFFAWVPPLGDGVVARAARLVAGAGITMAVHVVLAIGTGAAPLGDLLARLRSR